MNFTQRNIFIDQLCSVERALNLSIMTLTGVRLVLVPLLSSFILFLNAFAVHAQELEPRAYSNIPVGMNFAMAGYTNMSGGVLFDPAVPLENARIKINGSVLAYARSIKLGGLSGKFDAILPYL
jgi:hypothetical protein